MRTRKLQRRLIYFVAFLTTSLMFYFFVFPTSASRDNNEFLHLAFSAIVGLVVIAMVQRVYADQQVN